MYNTIRENDFILITDKNNNEYLQIGKVIEIENYPHSSDVKVYRVEFSDKICEYNYILEDICKVLMFKN